MRPTPNFASTAAPCCRPTSSRQKPPNHPRPPAAPENPDSSGGGSEPAWRDFHRSVGTAHPYRAVLNRDLQLHAALGQLGQCLALSRLNLPHQQIVSARQLAFNAFPPHRRAAGKAVHADALGAASGTHQALVIGLAHVNPVPHGIGVIPVSYTHLTLPTIYSV